MHLFAAIFLIFSGAAALVYQVTWVRLLGLSMGSTSASISTVLAAFFLGLAIGSYYAEKLSRNRINSFRPYVILEFCIGITGLVLLPILLNLDSLMASIPTLSGILAGKFVITMLLLCIPTICMGATFPVMAAILIRKENEIGLRLGQLYSLNTVGAIVGAVSAGFIFIPNFGLDGAIYIAVLLNFSVGIIAWMFNRKIQLPELEYATPPEEKSSDLPVVTRNQQIALLVLMGTGFASIASEIGWTKYLSIFTGTTIYGFAAILGIFLTGIAVGSWYIKNHLEKIEHPNRYLVYALILTALAMVGARVGMSFIPAIYEGVNSMSIDSTVRQGLKYFFVFLIIFPPTFLFGLIFPLNMKLYCGDLSGVQARVGKAYAANTIASILGSIVAGFWIIPAYGTDFLLTAMIFAVILLPLLFLRKDQISINRPVIVAASLSIFLIAIFTPHINYKDLISSVAYKYDADAGDGKKPEFLFVKEGKISVVSLITYDGRYAKVQANGLNESVIDMEDASNSLIIESLLAYMPYLMHKDPKTAFVVGYGGGITTRAFSNTNMESIKVVELEPAVVDAGKSIPNGPVIALKDPRINIEFNDARNTLLLDNSRYDIIAAQPSHPWLAGASNVFTQEFFHLVKSRLNDDGIFTQWINLFRMDATTLRSLTKAFFRVFPEGVTFANLETGDFMMLGSKQPVQFDFPQMNQRMKKPEILATFKHFDADRAEDLLWYFALSRDESLRAAGDILPNTDINIFSEVRLSAMLDEPTGEENPYQFLHKNFSFDILPYLTGKNQKAELYQAGLYFLEWESPDVTFKIAKQLYKVDQTWGKSLKHEIYYWRHDFQAATEWYNTQDKWTDETHLHQLEIHLEQKEWREASKVALRISDVNAYRTAKAMQLYFKGGLDELAQITPLSRAEEEWTLLGLTKQDLVSHGKKLVGITNIQTTSLPIIRTMIQYYAATNNHTKMNQWNQRMTEVIENKINLYGRLAEMALNDDNLSWNLALIKEIERLDPTADNLPELKKQRQMTLSPAT